MVLDHLGDMELTYRPESFDKFVLIRPYGGEEGAGYGEGEGRLKVNGSAGPQRRRITPAAVATERWYRMSTA